jgi:hypothetical protein
LSSKIIKHLAGITEWEWTLRDHLERFKRWGVNVNDDCCLPNINQPSDYKKYFPEGIKTGTAL